MKENERTKLRAMVRTMYDYQDMRIRTANRLRLNADEESVNEVFMDNAEIEEEKYEVIQNVFSSSNEIEKQLTKEIKKIVESQPIWTFFKNVRGCGPLMTAVCLSEFDIYKADTVSKMWQFAGLNPGMVKGKKIISITKNTDMAQVVREYENQKGEKKGIIVTNEMIRGDRKKAEFVSPYNAWLRSKLLGVLAGGMIKAQNGKGKSYALDFYYPYKARLEQEDNWKEESKGHRDKAAKRYMIKMFLKDLYVAWRTVEGLTVRPSYQEEYLNHVHSA